MGRKKTAWLPQIGTIASYVGRSSRMTKDGYKVRVVAEACGGRMVVEGIGRRGVAARFTLCAKSPVLQGRDE